MYIYLYTYKFIYLFICLFWLFKAVPTAYVSSQVRGPIGATAASLCHSHSNAGDLSHVSVARTTAHGNARSPTHWVRPGIEPTSSWVLIRFISAAPQRELLGYFFKAVIHVALGLWQTRSKCSWCPVRSPHRMGHPATLVLAAEGPCCLQGGHAHPIEQRSQVEQQRGMTGWSPCLKKD